jgi:hypothetical protein
MCTWSRLIRAAQSCSKCGGECPEISLKGGLCGACRQAAQEVQ